MPVPARKVNPGVIPTSPKKYALAEARAKLWKRVSYA